MKEQFADFETAKMLKELKFSEPCFASHQHIRGKGNLFEILSFPCNNNDNDGSEKTHSIFTLSAPLWQQVKQWLWEKHGIAVHFEWLSSFYYVIEQKGEIKKGGLTPHKSPMDAEVEGMKRAVESLYSKL